MANVPTTSWNEATPAGTDNVRDGDDRIRELKTQVREVVDVDHDFPSSGQASDVGQHKQVTLQEQANLGTGAVNATILGSQTVSGKGELTYTDEDDNDVQLTNAGKINATQSSQAAGSTSGPTTSSTSYVDLTDMSVTVTTGANPVLILFSGSFTNNANGQTDIIVEIDGTTKSASERESETGSDDHVISTSHLETMTAASHTFKIQWKAETGTSTATGVMRSMQVIELKG